MYWFGGLFKLSKDDIETNTMNVMFDGSDEKDDKDDDSIDLKTIEDDYYWSVYNRRYTVSR